MGSMQERRLMRFLMSVTLNNYQEGIFFFKKAYTKTNYKYPPATFGAAFSPPPTFAAISQITG